MLVSMACLITWNLDKLRIPFLITTETTGISWVTESVLFHRVNATDSTGKTSLSAMSGLTVPKATSETRAG